MRPILGSAAIYLAATGYFLVFNILWMRTTFRVIAFAAARKYSKMLPRATFKRVYDGRFRNFAVGIMGFLASIVIPIIQVIRPVVDSSDELHRIYLAGGVALFALPYALLPWFVYLRLKLALIGMNSSNWEDAFMAPPVPAFLFVYMKASFREMHLGVTLLSAVQAVIVIFGAFVSYGSTANPKTYRDLLGILSMGVTFALLFLISRLLVRTYSLRRPEYLIASQAIEFTSERGFHKTGLSSRRFSGRIFKDRGQHGSRDLGYRLFSPREWRSTEHSMMFSVARALVRLPARFRYRFTEIQLAEIERAAATLSSMLTSDYLRGENRDDTLELCMAYATALAFHEDPVFIGREIVRRFGEADSTGQLGARNFWNSISAFNEAIKTTGPIFKLILLATVITTLLLVGRQSELLELLRKLVGG